MMTKKNQIIIPTTQDDKDILDGKKPGVLFTVDDIINRNPVYTDSLDLPYDEYVRKHSLYYKNKSTK